jgi:hypothetical protein
MYPAPEACWKPAGRDDIIAGGDCSLRPIASIFLENRWNSDHAGEVEERGEPRNS